MRKSQIRLFRSLSRRFQRATGALLEGAECCGGVTLAQCHLLLEIEGRAGISLVDLAEALGLDKSTLSRSVEGLVERGLVERLPNPEDRRYNLHGVTEAGGKTVAEIHRSSDACVRRVFDRIPEADRERVLEAFGIVVEAMSAADASCRVKSP